jgi:hypothetical protein
VAEGARAIDRILRQGEGEPTPEQQAEIVAALRTMETAAAEIDPAGRQTNHPVIDRNIEAFRHDLAAARLAAERRPPNYFLAGSVAGSCRYCHAE